MEFTTTFPDAPVSVRAPDVPLTVIVAAVSYVMSVKPARPLEAALVAVPPNEPDDGATVTLSVSAVLLPYWSAISMVKVVHVAPAVTGVAGEVTHNNLFLVAAETVQANSWPVAVMLPSVVSIDATSVL